MSPPMNYTSNGTRRSQFSGLSTIDSGAPEEPQPPHWDSETDHLLSYFLEDPNGHNPPSYGNSYQGFSSSAHPHDSSTEMNAPPGMNASYGPGSRTSSNSTLTDVDPPQPRTPAMQFYHTSHHHSSSSSSHNQQQQQQPVSYARQTAENTASMQQQQQAAAQSQPGSMVSSGSSSELSSLAATLVSGGPVLHHQIHHQQQQHHHNQSSAAGNRTTERPGSANSGKLSRDSPPAHGDDSPISPAAMIGTGHENLMLPPPSRGNSRGATNNRQPGNPATTQHQQKRKDTTMSRQPTAQQTQQVYPPTAHMVYPGQNQPIEPSSNNNHNKDAHLEWLNQLNMRAKAAGSHNPAMTGGVVMMPPGSLVNMPQPQQPSAMQHPGSMPIPTAPGSHVFVPHAGPYSNAAAAVVAQNPMLYHPALGREFHMAVSSQGESEEKRARRLERNRESARKSRRRKKERLATLEAQVDKLHNQIEDERRNQVNAMCSTLIQFRLNEMAKLMDDFKERTEQLNSDPAAQQRLANILRGSSGGSQIVQATVEFQYTSLKHILLPRYQKFLLWLTLHDDGFFAAGKDEYTKKDGKQVLRVSSGRVSSKQIGDELTNGWKTEKTDGKKKSKADTPDIGERSNPTSRSLDAPRMWPLLCFELSISVDQEERLMQALKMLQQMENLANYRSQLAAATKLTSSLTEALTAQCRAASAREDRSLLQILTPAQAAKMKEWKAANQERIDKVIRERRPAPEKSDPVFKETSLEEFCKRLEEVLRISKK